MIGDCILIINKINNYQICPQKDNFAKSPICSVKKNTLSHTNKINLDNLAFQGNLTVFKDFANKKYLEFSLKKILKKFDSASLNLGADKKSNIRNILDNEKLDELLSSVKAQTGTLFLPNDPLENGFDQVKIVLQYLGVSLEPSQLNKFQNYFDLAKERKLLKNNTTEVLSYFKNLELFSSMKNAIDDSIMAMDTKIRCFGLSSEVRDIVIKSQKDLGVKLDIPDSKELGNFIYNKLSKQKQAGNSLPQEICFNDFDFFINNGPELSASYVNGAKPKKKKELISKYPALNETFNRKKIYFNPIFLLLRQDKGEFALISEDLGHELGHFWHNLIIGDKAFNSKEMNSLDGFLSGSDRNFLVDLENKLKNKICFIEDLNADSEVNDYICRIIPDLKSIINNRDNYELKDILDKGIITRFNQITDKLEKTAQITLKQFTDCEDEALYALTSPKELVAFSIQKNHNHKYDEDFINMLKDLGLPQINNNKFY